MKKQVDILVIGDAGEAVPDFLGQPQDHHRFTYCARDDCARGSAERPGRCYDWVVIEGESLVRDETDLIQSLRAMGFFLHENKRGEHRCGVEWSREGVLQLRCCMQASARAPGCRAQQTDAGPQNGFVFEYHAPVKRTG